MQLRQFCRLTAAALTAATLSLAAQAAVAQTNGTVPITDGDQCHSCDMWITKHPGPKGEIVTTSGKVYKFCSTKCMLCTLRRVVENEAMKGIFVHDVSKTDWDKPTEDAFMDAKKAWYVGGSVRKATMGKSFAPFPTRELAEQFQEEFGGKIYTYEELTPEILGCRMPRKPFEPIR